MFTETGFQGFELYFCALTILKCEIIACLLLIKAFKHIKESLYRWIVELSTFQYLPKTKSIWILHFDGLVLERRNSIANALNLRLC